MQTHTHTYTHTHIYIKCKKWGWDEIVMYPLPRFELGKLWHGLSRNQGVVGEHDEQYQMLVRNWVGFDLKQNRGYPLSQCDDGRIQVR
jgi:hypothetical protein